MIPDNNSENGSPDNLFGYNPINTGIMKKIIEHPVRLRIFLSLYLYPELYVTEISKFLKMDKNTISRHLRRMEKDGILKSREVETRGKINRKYYRLTEEYMFNIEDYRPLLNFNNPILRIFSLIEDKKSKKLRARKKFIIKKFFNLLEALVLFIVKGFELYLPLLNSMESEIEDLEHAESLFGKFFKPPRKIDFYPIIVSEERLSEVNKLLEDFTSKLIKIRDKGETKGEQKSIMVLSALVPLKDLLEKIY
ncbi:MAG: ArsR/SmtB family transcription factor [Promethearchaeota archaeon]